jgi:hypothetical protein
LREGRHFRRSCEMVTVILVLVLLSSLSRCLFPVTQGALKCTILNERLTTVPAYLPFLVARQSAWILVCGQRYTATKVYVHDRDPG